MKHTIKRLSTAYLEGVKHMQVAHKPGIEKVEQRQALLFSSVESTRSQTKKH